jgi:hypothetical protein
MKGRPLILIFLFLAIFLFLIHPVSAGTGSFSWSGSDMTTYEHGTGVFVSGTYYIDYIIVNDAGTLNSIDYVMARTGNSTFTGTEISQWVSATYKVGGVTVGTGTYGYLQNGDGSVTIAAFMNDDFSLDAYSGKQVVEIVSSLSLQQQHSPSETSVKGHSSVDDTTATMAYLGYTPAGSYVVSDDTESTLHTASSSYDFSNSYTYSHNGTYLYFDLERDTDSQLYVIINNTYEEVINETGSGLQDADLTFPWYDIVNNTWDITAYNGYGDTDTHVINFIGVSTADIEFNQTSYTDPENIVVSGEITNMDNDNYVYLIEMTSTIDGDVSSSFFEASGNWNVSPYITFCCGAVMFDFYSDGYDLPVWIQSNLWTKNKNTGVWTKLANTPAVIYHEATIQGKISSDKSSYNVSEIVTVTYTSYADDIKIRAYQHGSITTYWYNDLPSGTDKTIKITFDEKDRGPWDLRLIENDIFTNSTSIEITSGDTPYVKWYQSVYNEGQIAPYRIGGSGGLMLYSTDVNAALSIFDAAGTEIYNFSVGSGNDNMQINFAESAAPGMWTASLLNLGSRYNDTTMVTYTGSVLCFNSSSYELGDTIGINYFIPSSNYRIMLIDGNFKEIIIFTTQNGVISTGTYQTLPFSLVDNNEYGFDMIAAIDAGTYATGYWEVWVVDQYGTFLDNGTVWDRAKVTTSTDDPVDASNDIMMIFFSRYIF